jgi:predicted XRE-type DNA-binding protein
MAKKPLIPVTPSSGNVFADIGVSHLTQVATATVMGIDQPKVSALLSGRLTNFSSERLMRLLTRLGQDVEIVVKSKPRGRQRGRIRVLEEIRS